MSLRLKLKLFMFAFIATALILGAGAFYIFSNLNRNLSAIGLEIDYNRAYVELRTAIREAMDNTRGWALTGNPKYLRGYEQSIPLVYKGFGEVEKLLGPTEEIRAIGNDFQAIKINADRITKMPSPVGNIDVLNTLRVVEERKDGIFAKMDGLYEKSMGDMVSLVSLGERIRRNTTIYLGILVFSVTLMFVFLVLFMRRMLSEPFSEMLDATEKVAAGDLSFRISSDRRDEFGLIAGRFDAMVERLEGSKRKSDDRLKETELLLDVARIAGMTPELKEALSLIVDTVAGKLEKDVCAVLILKPERNAFFLEAINRKDIPMDMSLEIESPLARMVLEKMKPVMIQDTSLLPAEDGLMCSLCKSLLITPILRDHICKGLLVIGRFSPYGFEPDEKDAVMILAHTIGAAMRNAELYTTAKKQLRQISVTYDLSKALTSLYKLDEILETISSEVSKITGARICIIRLMEGGLLNIKSSYGIPKEEADGMSLEVGEGIAGWVVKEGRSLFVEDISKLPETLKPKTIQARSAICVPLRVADRIIGTLGLYDKTTERNVLQPFDLDDLAMAEGFASISAIAIEKTRIEEEERLRRQEVFEAKKRLDLLFDTVQGGIVSIDRQFKILAANRYVERWVDMPLGEIVGNDAREVFHPKGGICPHCAAHATFETGDINSITQSSGLNYAELTAYPVKDAEGKLSEVVVFIQDITDRILYQEEIMELYREVAQTKEYLESLINNSADAIITTDIEGTVTSWNQAAEKIYDYAEREVMGKFLPFLPEFLIDQERHYMELLKEGEVIRTETFRRTKKGDLIEVSLTLSPIKDAAGEVIGISGISRDITKKKQVERELIRRNQELSRLFFISSAMRGTLNFERLLRMILTAVTMSDGLGFNRAILFLVDEAKNALRGAMGVGPASPDEAAKIWEGLTTNQRTLHDIIKELEESSVKEESPFDRLAKSLEISLEQETVLAKAVRDKMPFNILDVKSESLADIALLRQVGGFAYAVVPLISRNRVIGVLWVDNLFNKRLITEEDMQFLNTFSNQMASAIENARLFEQISVAETELENIFRSISDMVYLTDGDFNLKKVNDAVLKRIGKPASEVVGKKCYQIFHGVDSPLPTCPHLKTVETRKANIEEYDDPYLDGTFISSTSPLFDAEGGFLGVVHVVRDVTEMKELRERLQSAERMAALGEVAAKVAHEIRNPLVSVGGFAKRLEKKLDGNLKEYAGIIAGEVERLEHILREILGFVREVRTYRRGTVLDELTGSVVNLLESEINEKGNVVTMEFEPVSVLIDPNRMKEAIFNIITNANQGTDGGTVGVKVYKTEKEAVVEVSDTGCGIKKEDLPRIFDPFFTTRPMGTGLGLAIAKRIVEEHGGRISVSSRWPSGGSTFKIFLPLKEEAMT